MNTTDFTYLLNKPEAVNQKQSEALDTVLERKIITAKRTL
jgi:hypothetical protein